VRRSSPFGNEKRQLRRYLIGYSVSAMLIGTVIGFLAGRLGCLLLHSLLSPLQSRVLSILFTVGGFIIGIVEIVKTIRISVRAFREFQSEQRTNPEERS